MTALAAPNREAARTHADSERLIRNFLFLATLLLSWFTVSPFPDLSETQSLGINGNPLSQASSVLMTGALFCYVLIKRPPLLPRIVTLPLVLTMLAFAISAVRSSYPDVAERRLLLACFNVLQAGILLLLPYGRQHLARLLTTVAIIVLAACYFGVTFLPQLSIHQATDIAEPGLAGDWRGFFMHKNSAGTAMVLLIFFGIFIYRTWNRYTGTGIIIFAGVFLYFTHSKSPISLLPVVLLLSYLIPRLRSSLLSLGVIVGVPLTLNVLGVGSVMFAPIHDLVAHLISDPSYTGRDVIWQFALDHIPQRPLFGFGYESFWGMPDLVAEWNYLEPWGYRASDAHNGYLNLAVTTGFVGLGLALWLIVVQPFADYRRALARGADRSLIILFMQIWLFTLCVACYESMFFGGGNVLWFLMLVPVFGFRFQAMAKNCE
ncbi:MAG: O-antigen ligase [Xanthobacteraceae bacterium]